MEINSWKDLIVIFSKASLVTIEVALLAILIALVLGFVCSVILYYEVPVLSIFIKIYVVFFRNTPSLIQAYFLFYGLPKLFIVLDSFTCSVLVLSLLGGAYMCEALLAAIKAISINQKELAIAIGLSKIDTVRYLILPQSLSISIAAINNNALFLTKEVSAMKLILLPEIVYQAFSIISLRADLILPVTILMICSYLILLVPMSILFARIERRIRYAEFGN